jgi:hypothetical protein
MPSIFSPPLLAYLCQKVPQVRLERCDRKLDVFLKKFTLKNRNFIKGSRKKDLFLKGLYCM